MGSPLGDEDGTFDARSEARPLGLNEGLVDCDRFVGADDGGCELEAVVPLGTAEGERLGAVDPVPSLVGSPLGDEDGTFDARSEARPLGLNEGLVDCDRFVGADDGGCELEAVVPLGTAEGERLGAVEPVPSLVGSPLGDEDGTFDARSEARPLGLNEGLVDCDRFVGADDGGCELEAVVPLGTAEGERLGAVEPVPSLVGRPLGDEDGTFDARSEARPLGLNEGLVDCDRFVGADDGGCELEAVVPLGTAEGERLGAVEPVP